MVLFLDGRARLAASLAALASLLASTTASASNRQ